jgi:hypothetical protein
MVDQSLIYKIEQGRIPSWPLLIGLCQVYQLDFTETVVVLAYAVEFTGSSSLLSAAHHGRTTGQGSRYEQIPRGEIAKELRSLTNAFHKAFTDVARQLLGSTETTTRPRRARKDRRIESRHLRRA